MDYKNINENWQKFVENEEALEEGWKEKLAGGIGFLELWDLKSQRISAPNLKQ